MSSGELGTSELGSSTLGGDFNIVVESKRNGTGARGIKDELNDVDEEFQILDTLVVGPNRIAIDLT